MVTCSRRIMFVMSTYMEVKKAMYKMLKKATGIDKLSINFFPPCLLQ